MKTKVTTKQLKNNFSTVLSVGYCDAQNLFKNLKPFGYNCGVYGWNFDAYEIPDTSICITTGYRPTGKSLDYNFLQKYEKMMRSAGEKYGYFTPQRKAQETRIFNKFVKELKQMYC
jgi:hypothetical protein